jgi:hypothetical protein
MAMNPNKKASEMEASFPYHDERVRRGLCRIYDIALAKLARQSGQHDAECQVLSTDIVKNRTLRDVVK